MPEIEVRTLSRTIREPTLLRSHCRKCLLDLVSLDEPWFFSAALEERYSQIESVVVVARNGDQIIYYEDMEDGFNVSPISPYGRVLEHWCNQDQLRCALNAWIERRGLPEYFGPAVALDY